MARLVLSAPMAAVATPELVSRLERAVALFPELGDERITIGVTASRGIDGLAFARERLIRLNPYRRRVVTYFTIGHELTHLVQPPGLGLIPSGEVQCDIWTIARDPLFLDEKPCYLEVDCDGRSWRRHARAVRELCRRAIAVRGRNRCYIVWLREQLSAYFDRPGQLELFTDSVTTPNPSQSPRPDPLPGEEGDPGACASTARAVPGE